MRFLSLYKPGRDAGAAPPNPELMAKIGKYCEEMGKRGVLLGTEGCQHSSKGARIRIVGDRFKVIDGPFTEAKEIIGGLALLQAESKEEAIEMVKGFLQVMGEGECELRELYDGSECPGNPERLKAAAEPQLQPG
jgi:hypothetical protein